MAGGNGSRLSPLTRVISKHLLPVFNKPMVYYPLGTLMLAGIRDILVVATSRDMPQFKVLLGDGSHLGLNLTFAIQDEPRGIAHGLLLAEEFAQGGNIALILGDNIFYGSGMGEMLRSLTSKPGATVFVQQVTDPSRYGVMELDPDGKPRTIVEKPSSPLSNLAVTGLYLYDNSVFDRAKTLEPSDRGELEITDLNLAYLRTGELSAVTLPRGTAWLDTGTFESLAQAADFVKAVESRQGLMISSPEEIAWNRHYISGDDLSKLAKSYGTGDYARYLMGLVGPTI